MRSREYSERLRLSNRVREPAIRQAIQELEIREGSFGLDVGCGIGEHTLWLAAMVGSAGKVTGLDISADNLAMGNRLARESPLGGLVEFTGGNLLRMPFENGSFDWVWCADTLWPMGLTNDPIAAVAELARVTKPGGTIALVYWSSQSLLPGHPVLEACLNSAFSATTPYLGNIGPGQHFLRALGWLKSVGLDRCTARSYVADLQAPFDRNMREAIAFCFEMFWGDLKPHVSEDSWNAYRRLCNPDSDAFILDTPDYYGFLVYTLFSGQVKPCH